MKITRDEGRVLDRIHLLFEEGEEFTSREAMEKLNSFVGEEIDGFSFTLNAIPKSPYRMTAILKKDKRITRRKNSSLNTTRFKIKEVVT